MGTPRPLISSSGRGSGMQRKRPSPMRRRRGRKMQAGCIGVHCLWRLLCAGIVGSRSDLFSGHQVYRLSSPCLLSGIPAFLPSVGCRACAFARVFLWMLGSGLRLLVSPIRKFLFYSDRLVFLALIRCFGWAMMGSIGRYR